MSSGRLATLLVALVLPPVGAWAEDLVSAEAAGQGGATVAHPRDPANVDLAPASIALTERYDVRANYAFRPTLGHRWRVGVVDGRTSDRVVFGIAYTGGVTTPPFHPDELPGWSVAGVDPVNRKTTHDVTVAVATPFLDRKLAVGLNGTLMIFRGTYVGNGVSGNVDASVIGRPIPELTLSLVGRDVLPIADQLDRPATLVFGVRGGLEDTIVAAAEADYRFEHATGLPWAARVGVEGTIRELVRLRGGYDWHGDEGHRVGWGFGAYSDAGSLDYGMRLPLPGADETFRFGDVQHLFTLTIFTDALRRERDDEVSPIAWPDERRGDRKKRKPVRNPTR